MSVSKPPVARKETYFHTYHNKQFEDPYFWIRNKESPNVIDYLQAENSFFEQNMSKHTDLIDTIYNELVQRTKEDDMSVPEKHGPFYYYYRIEKGKNYRIYCRKKTLASPEEIILDLNLLSEGKNFLSLGSYDMSPDHTYIAYTLDYDGYENYKLFIKHLLSGQVYSFDISNLDGQIYWGLDSSTVFYCKRDKIHRSSYTYKASFTLPSGKEVQNFKEELLYFEEDEIFYTYMSKSKDNKFIFITSASSETTEVRALSLKTNSLAIIDKRSFSVLYYVYHHEGFFYKRTNEKALNFKILRSKVENFSNNSKWEEFVLGNDAVKIDSLEMFEKFIVMYTRKNGLQNINIYNVSTKSWHDVALPESLYAINNRGSPENYEYKSEVLRIHYESLKTPKSVYDYNMNLKSLELKKKDEIHGFNSDLYVMKREFVQVRDGAKIPISIIHAKNITKNGSNLTYLYGYGSYGSSIDPGFNANILSLIERNFVYVIAHIRGGGEMGRQWYLNGKYFHKKNTFFDFIDVAKYLIEQKYTSTSKLVITGRSAGGLLMGAVLNMAPQLFKAAVMGVPFVDVVNTMSDETIPLTTFEWEEWGDPRKPDFFEYMLSYSPYDNISKQSYPHILVTAGLNDPRVPYWEPAKFVAKLRTLKTDTNDLLLKVNMGAGHMGASGKYALLKEVAQEFAFILAHV